MKEIAPLKVKIEHTYNYDKFQFIGINRDVNKKHVMNIADAIQFRNLLHLFPVIVNPEWEVMDGQHRIGAAKMIMSAKELKLPVYYIMDPDITTDDISLLNTNKINWKNIDYVNYFAGKKFSAYLDLVQFMKENPKLPLSCVMMLICSKGRNIEALKNGTFDSVLIDKGHLIIQYVYDLVERMKPGEFFWKTGNFITAIKAIVDTKKYVHQTMMKSSYNKREYWNHQFTTRSYIYEINKMYNFDLPVDERVDFMKLTRDVYN